MTKTRSLTVLACAAALLSTPALAAPVHHHVKHHLRDATAIPAPSAPAAADGFVARAPEEAAPPAQPASMPRMDADGFLPRQKDSSFYEHAAGNMGTP